MIVQKQRLPSFAAIISVLTIVCYCAGFLRVELELHEQKKRIKALESVAAPTNLPSNDADIKLNKNAPGIQNYEVPHRYSRQVDSTKNATEAKGTEKTMLKINKLLLEGKVHLCPSKGDMCSSGPPGPPGPSGPRGHKGTRGRRGQKGRTGAKGDKGIMGLQGKSGKQGIMGPVGLKGENGAKGAKGDMGSTGMPGTKGDPGKSMSSPTVLVFPVKLTINESESALFQCSASGNPEPAVVWNKLENHAEIIQSAISGGNLQLTNVTRNDSGIYQCSATNILGKAWAVAQLVVNVGPLVSLHPGPTYVVEESNVTLPTCHVTGHPQPVVTWSKSLGQLPRGRVQFNNNTIKLLDVRKGDSDSYLCTASNLLGNAVQKTLLVVVTLPHFIVKPPVKVLVTPGDFVVLNCSATGVPQPVISWKRQAATLPVGRSQQINGALIIKNTRMDDTGNYICVATSARVFHVETGSYIAVQIPKDCSDLLKSGHTQSGVYSVNPDGRGHFTVYCDMRTDGGGWTVFQRRRDGSVDFYRGWNDYKTGFGPLTAEFWLGNDKIHRLTASRSSSLRVELEDWKGVRAYAKYGKFNIGDEQALYRLEVGLYSGTAGDSLAFQNSMAFTTKDRDNDRHTSVNCGAFYTGAWWYNSCHHSNLNGKYLGQKDGDDRGVRWYHFRNSLSLKFTEMKLRPSS